MGSISYEEFMARYSKEERREIARDVLRAESEIVGLNDKSDAVRILKRSTDSEQRTIMLGMARREARMAQCMPIGNDPEDVDDDGLEINTSYRQLLDAFSKKQQRAIERGARLLQARYAKLPAKYKTRKPGEYFIIPEDAEPLTFAAYLETLPKSEQEALLRKIDEDVTRHLAEDRLAEGRRKAQNKTKANNKATSTSDSPASPPVPLSAKGK